MYLSGQDKSSSDNAPLHKNPPSPGRLMLGMPPVNDENHQNSRIQQAVNRYNGLTSSLWRPSNLFKCNLLKSKIFKSSGDSYSTLKNSPTAVSAENRYDCAGSFPRVLLTQHQQPEKRLHKYDLNSSTTDILPVSRYLEDSSGKYLDLSPTRAVLDVLQDLSRKRIHGRDDVEEHGKRRCRGLGGETVVDGQVPYKPLFVSPPKIVSMAKKDQTTQTLTSADKLAGKTTEDVSVSPNESSSKEKRRKLPRRTNAIMASLSSSINGPWLKRKRDVPKMTGSSNILKRPKVASLTEDPKSPTELERSRSALFQLSPPRTEDRLTNIYFDLENSANLKRTVLESLRSTSSKTSPTIGNPNADSFLDQEKFKIDSSVADNGAHTKPSIKDRDVNCLSTMVETSSKPIQPLDQKFSTEMANCTAGSTISSSTKQPSNDLQSTSVIPAIVLPCPTTSATTMPSIGSCEKFINLTKEVSPIVTIGSSPNSKPTLETSSAHLMKTDTTTPTFTSNVLVKDVSIGQSPIMNQAKPNETAKMTSLVTSTTSVFSRLDSPSVSCGAVGNDVKAVESVQNPAKSSSALFGSKQNLSTGDSGFNTSSESKWSSASPFIGNTGANNSPTLKAANPTTFAPPSFSFGKPSESNTKTSVPLVNNSMTFGAVTQAQNPASQPTVSISFGSQNNNSTFTNNITESGTTKTNLPPSAPILQTGQTNTPPSILFNFGTSTAPSTQQPATTSSFTFTSNTTSSKDLSMKPTGNTTSAFLFEPNKTLPTSTQQPVNFGNGVKTNNLSLAFVTTNKKTEESASASNQSFAFGDNNEIPKVSSIGFNVDQQKSGNLPFSFSSSNPAPAVSSGPTFASATSSFGIGNNSNSLFAFGKSQTSDANATTPSPFDTNQEKAMKSSNAFSFGSNQQTNSPSLGLTTSANSSSSPLFSFGSGQKPVSASSTSTTFAFGRGSQETPETPKFAFGSNQQSNAVQPTMFFGSGQQSQTPSSSTSTPFANNLQQSQTPSSTSTPFTSNLQQSKPAFAFGSPQITTNPTAPFAFGSGSQLKPQIPLSSAPSFAFDSGQPQKPLTSSAPSFSFGSAQEANPTTSAFAFGASQQNPNSGSKFTFNSNQPSPATSSFSFGSVSKSNPEPSGSAFGFAASQTASPSPVSPFAFGSNQPISTQSQHISFSFGSTNNATIQSSSAQSEPFAFGNPTNNNTQQSTLPVQSPTFAFGSTNNVAAPSGPSFNFGSVNNSSAASKPPESVFSFGSPSPSTSAFKFGSPNTSSNPTSGFSFGANSQGGAFNFGQTSIPAPTSTLAPSTPGTPQGFGIPGTFNIGSGSTHSRASRAALRRRRP